MKWMIRCLVAISSLFCLLVYWVNLVLVFILIKPMRLGGLNLKSAKFMTQAFLAKLGWRILTCTNYSWCKVLRAKYEILDEDGAHLGGNNEARKSGEGPLGDLSCYARD